MLWARALRGTLANPQVISDVLMQRDRHPSKVSGKDFFRECAWAIYTTRTSKGAVDKVWTEVERVFYHWDYELVCRNVGKVRSAALNIGIRFRVRKVEATIAVAQKLHDDGWAGIREQLIYGLKVDSQGNIIPDESVIKFLDRLPMVGRANRRYISKNIGYDVAKPDEHLTSLGPRFGYAGDEGGVQQFATEISQLVGERISVVDTVLWWADKLKTNLSFTCPACGRQR